MLCSLALSTSRSEAALGRLAADIDVGGDVEIVEEVEFLVDEGDAGLHRAADAEAAIGHAIDLDGAAVGLDHAAEDLHQGGFAGAVLADHADDLAGADIEAEIGKGDDARVGLAQPGQLEERLGGAGDAAGAAAAAVMAPGLSLCVRTRNARNRRTGCGR